MLERNVE
jgi:uncharacterized protein YlxW (UPF0749 family)